VFAHEPTDYRDFFDFLAKVALGIWDDEERQTTWRRVAAATRERSDECRGRNALATLETQSKPRA
jgi:hypothetical protein